MPQAKRYADRQVTHYCRVHSDCQNLRQTRAQRIKDRWLVDYDSSGRVFTVTVDDGGSAKLDIWNK